MHSWQTNRVQLSRAPSWGINVASPKFFSRKALIDHDNEFCEVLSISNILFDPERFRDRLKQPSDNSKLNNSFHFQREGSRMIYQRQTLIVSRLHKIIPKKHSDKVKIVASILKIPKYFLLARPLILTQKQIINGYFRCKSFILLY